MNLVMKSLSTGRKLFMPETKDKFQITTYLLIVSVHTNIDICFSWTLSAGLVIFGGKSNLKNGEGHAEKGLRLNFCCDNTASVHGHMLYQPSY